MTLPIEPASTKHKNTIFFDIDGTLLLTRQGRKAMSDAFHHHFNVPNAFSDVSFAGATDPGVVDKICKQHDLTLNQQQYNGFYRDYYQRLEQMLDGEFEIMAGSHELLRILRGKDLHLGIITGNNPGGAHVKLRQGGFLDYFEGGAYGRDGPERSQIVRTALERFDAHDGSTVVIGDSIHDIRTGKEHGMNTIAVGTGTTSPDKLKRENPDLYLDSLAPPKDLIEFLNDNQFL